MALCNSEMWNVLCLIWLFPNWFNPSRVVEAQHCVVLRMQFLDYLASPYIYESLSIEVYSPCPSQEVETQGSFESYLSRTLDNTVITIPTCQPHFIGELVLMAGNFEHHLGISFTDTKRWLIPCLNDFDPSYGQLTICGFEYVMDILYTICVYLDSNMFPTLLHHCCDALSILSLSSHEL